jgi:hypothetical protein
MDLTIRGADQLGDLAKALRAAGDGGKGLKRELHRGMNRATKPLRAEAQQAAKTRLPQSGGLAASVAKSKFSTRILTGRNPGVSIQAKGGSAAATTDRGFVKHPVFGNRSRWVTQSVEGGWFTKTMRGGAPVVRKELVEAIENVADQIRRS